MSSFLKDVSSIGLSKVLMIVFGLGRAIIIARWLGPEGNGIIATLAVYPSLLITLGSLGISQSATHFLGTDKYNENKLKISISQIWLFTTSISLLLGFILLYYVSDVRQNLLWIIFAIMPIPFNLFNNYNSGIFLGKNKISEYNKINWLPTAFIFIGIIFLVVVLRLQINGVLIASVCGPFFMFLYLFIKNDFLSSFSLNFDWKLIKSLLSLGTVYAISLLLINLNYKIDVIILDKISTPYETGIYSKGVALTDYLWYIPALLSTVVFARSATAKDGVKFSFKVAQLLRLSVILIGIGSIILYFLAKYVIILLFGSEFLPSAEVLQLLLPGVILLTIFKVLNMDLAGKGKPWIAMKAMVPALIINIMLNFIFIPECGANGAAIASTISYTLAALLFLYFYSKEVQLTIKQILWYSKSDFKPVFSIIKKLF